jgi:hypothetical protein
MESGILNVFYMRLMNTLEDYSDESDDFRLDAFDDADFLNVNDSIDQLDNYMRIVGTFSNYFPRIEFPC